MYSRMQRNPKLLCAYVCRSIYVGLYIYTCVCVSVSVNVGVCMCVCVIMFYLCKIVHTSTDKYVWLSVDTFMRILSVLVYVLCTIDVLAKVQLYTCTCRSSCTRKLIVKMCICKLDDIQPQKAFLISAKMSYLWEADVASLKTFLRALKLIGVYDCHKIDVFRPVLHLSRRF